MLISNFVLSLLYSKSTDDLVTFKLIMKLPNTLIEAMTISMISLFLH